MNSWYKFTAQSSDAVEIDIFDEIGFWGIRAKDFLTELKKYPDAKTITLRLNSPGGEVFDGIAIYNALKRHPAKVTAVVYGYAASIASVIAMAADTVVMPENTFMFIHDPVSYVIGDAEDMRAVADELETIGGALIASYRSKTGKSDKEIKSWMAGDTWFSAAEALAAGLADEVTGAVQIAAKAGRSVLANMPAALRAIIDDQARSQADAADAEKAARRGEAQAILDLCKNAGVADWAGELMAKGKSSAEVAQLLQHASAIHDRCAAANMRERAANYIKASLTPEEVSEDLLKRKAALAGDDIDSRLGPATPKAPAAQMIDTEAIRARYAGGAKKK